MVALFGCGGPPSTWARTRGQLIEIEDAVAPCGGQTVSSLFTLVADDGQE